MYLVCIGFGLNLRIKAVASLLTKGKGQNEFHFMNSALLYGMQGIVPGIAKGKLGTVVTLVGTHELFPYFVKLDFPPLPSSLFQLFLPVKHCITGVRVPLFNK